MHSRPFPQDICNLKIQIKKGKSQKVLKKSNTSQFFAFSFNFCKNQVVLVSFW